MRFKHHSKVRVAPNPRAGMLGAMRCSIALAAALSLAGLSGARAGEPEDQYLGICGLIREADALLPASRASEALPKYNEAKEALQKLQRAFPDWNTEIIRYRLGYLTNRVANLMSQSAAPGNPDATGPRPAAAAAPFVEWEVQLVGLQEQVRQLQADKALLEAKLKEALGVLPSASDPREMARLQGRVQALERENALLAATVTQMRFQLGSGTLFSPLDGVPAATNMDLLQQAERERLHALERGRAGTNAPAGRRTVVRVEGEPAGK